MTYDYTLNDYNFHKTRTKISSQANVCLLSSPPEFAHNPVHYLPNSWLYIPTKTAFGYRWQIRGKSQEETTCGVLNSRPTRGSSWRYAQQPLSSCFQEHHIILMCGWAGVAAITGTQWEQYLHQVYANRSALVQRGRRYYSSFQKFFRRGQ